MNDTFSLTCTCGNSADGLTNDTAYYSGWRLEKKAPLCPICAGKADQKHRAECVKKYGHTAAERADRMVARLHR